MPSRESPGSAFRWLVGQGSPRARPRRGRTGCSARRRRTRGARVHHVSRSLRGSERHRRRAGGALAGTQPTRRHRRPHTRRIRPRGDAALSVRRHSPVRGGEADGRARADASGAGAFFDEHDREGGRTLVGVDRRRCSPASRRSPSGVAMGGHLYAAESRDRRTRPSACVGCSRSASRRPRAHWPRARRAPRSSRSPSRWGRGRWTMSRRRAAARFSEIAKYTPSAALRVFEHGELRLATVLVLLTFGDRRPRRRDRVASRGPADVAARRWCRSARPPLARCSALDSRASARAATSAKTAGTRFRSPTKPRSGRSRQPLHVTVYLAAEDPRLVDLERGVLAKLRAHDAGGRCHVCARRAAADCSSDRASTMARCGMSSEASAR